MAKEKKDQSTSVQANRRGFSGIKTGPPGLPQLPGSFPQLFQRVQKFIKLLILNIQNSYYRKLFAAFKFGLENPGVCQTAPGTAPYFYEEDNWVDDMELAAAELYNLTKELKYLRYAVEFGRKELVTPWMGRDTARHYQWYPFVNMGHPAIARELSNEKSNEFAGYMKKGLELTALKAAKNPFLIGIPFIWCSNNLVSSDFNPGTPVY